MSAPKMNTWITHHPCPHRPTLDPPYGETDRISPHHGHVIQPLQEGTWVCMTCDGSALADWLDDHACADEVRIEYDCGRGPEDFYQVEDELTCGKGHVVPQGIAESWYPNDAQDYASDLQDQDDAAREAYDQSKRERD